MKVTVIGMGQVGAVAAAGLALSGHRVMAVDIDRARILALQSGKYPGCEPMLADRIGTALRSGNIRFRPCDEVDEDLGEVALVAVGTPPARGMPPT